MNDMLQKARLEITSVISSFITAFSLSYSLRTTEEGQEITFLRLILAFKQIHAGIFFYSDFLSLPTNTCKAKRRYGMDDGS